MASLSGDSLASEDISKAIEDRKKKTVLPTTSSGSTAPKRRTTPNILSKPPRLPAKKSKPAPPSPPPSPPPVQQAQEYNTQLIGDEDDEYEDDEDIEYVDEEMDEDEAAALAAADGEPVYDAQPVPRDELNLEQQANAQPSTSTPLSAGNGATSAGGDDNTLVLPKAVLEQNMVCSHKNFSLYCNLGDFNRLSFHYEGFYSDLYGNKDLKGILVVGIKKAPLFDLTLMVKIKKYFSMQLLSEHDHWQIIAQKNTNLSTPIYILHPLSNRKLVLFFSFVKEAKKTKK